jgi:multidrug efflux system membrane fusion protein
VNANPPRRRLVAPSVRVTALLACIAVIAGSAGCARRPPQRGGRASVTVAAVERREMPFALASTGTVEAVQTAVLTAQVGGTVTRVAFREGGHVAEGQPLIELDPRPFRAALEQARAAHARDRAQAVIARLEAERAETLFGQGLLSQAERDQKRAASETWEATVRADSATLDNARLNLDYATIRAPFAGRTGQVMVNVGETVRAASGVPLVTVNRIHPVRVRFTVPVSAVPLVQAHRDGRPRVIARAADSTEYEGPLVFVDNAVDPASGTLLLKGEFANRDGRLVPGQFVDVRLVLYRDPAAVVVPAAAVTNGQEGAYVYVMNADSTVTSRPVQVSRTVDDLAVVAAGLQPGETVVTDGQLRLSPGAKVVVRSPERAAR